MLMSVTQNYADSKQKSYKIIIIKMFTVHGKTQHRKYKKLKLSGGQVYDLSSG
jgi:hypothetical protein